MLLFWIQAQAVFNVRSSGWRLPWTDLVTDLTFQGSQAKAA